ncbi:LA_2272 family surface repeat-containing protein [Pontibacter sp. G13]|uniref:LA_2272 family surface repeat-containing protein n=1 Tax=Pontibacter sp. G13 TaxID=3074898 RepID=UPI002889A2C6|nr:hypothetical protein [Pontibacter sp. G13]WNJ19062.1 hypothetical protein RJD25_01105 [Pontibacter sp. G13]
MRTFVLFALALAGFSAYAQESRVAQVTFFYPLGTNGVRSMEYANNFSFNVLFGLNGGVNGVEIGSIFNYNAGDMNGVQIGGVSNINTMNGDGLMLSGVANVSGGSFNGAAIAGVGNYIHEDFNGFQLGVINITRNTLKGVQLGIVNFQGDNQGVPIGLINIAVGGLYQFELTAGETIYGNLNFKMGVERFYSIYKVGISSYESNPVYSFGFGFGSYLVRTDDHHLSLDLSGSQIIYDNEWDNELNLLAKLDLNYEWAIMPSFGILVGPSFNYYLTEERVNGDLGTLNVPYTIFDNEWSDGKGEFWIGGNLGVWLRL